MGIVNFKGNPHDSKTIEATLQQVERLTGKKIKKAIVDRGYRAKKQIRATQIISPTITKDPAKRVAYRKRFRRRAAIEPVIGHVKNQYGMKRNFLKGDIGDIVNATLAGAAFNFKRWLNLKLQELRWLWRFLIYNLEFIFWGFTILKDLCRKNWLRAEWNKTKKTELIV